MGEGSSGGARLPSSLGGGGSTLGHLSSAKSLGGGGGGGSVRGLGKGTTRGLTISGSLPSSQPKQRQGGFFGRQDFSGGDFCVGEFDRVDVGNGSFEYMLTRGISYTSPSAPGTMLTIARKNRDAWKLDEVPGEGSQ